MGCDRTFSKYNIEIIETNKLSNLIGIAHCMQKILIQLCYNFA